MNRPPLRVLYFAWLRERVGVDEETIAPAPETRSPADLVAQLRARSPAHARAFADLARVHVAVDEAHADWDAPLAGAREVAFFPPVTGG